MIVFTVTTVLDAAYYRVRMYSRVPRLRLYSFSDDLPGESLGRLTRLPWTLLGSIRRFGIKKAVRGNCNAAGYVRQCSAGWNVSSGTRLRTRAIVDTAGMKPAFLTILHTETPMANRLHLASAAILQPATLRSSMLSEWFRRTPELVLRILSRSYPTPGTRKSRGMRPCQLHVRYSH